MKLSVSQTQALNNYMNAHPQISREKAIQQLFGGGGTPQQGKGVSVEKSGKKTINLPSGRKIVIQNGTVKYFSADGTQLNKKYFEKQEGKIDIKPSGRYSITKAGKTRYFAANGVELKETYFKKVENPDVIVKTNGKNYNLNKSIEKRINKVTSDLKKAEDENGLIGKAWSWAKNTGGFGDSSNKVREQQKKEQQLLAQFNSNPQRRGVIFKQLTGADYTPENLEKFIKGQILLRSESALRGYKEGQEMAVDVVADVVSGVVSFGVYTAAVAAAPFTGGASIAVGVAAAAGTGALVKTGIKYADAKSGGRDYTLKDAGHDAATGAFSGALAPVTAGAGGAVGKVVTVQAGKAGLKAGAAKAVGFTANMVTDGAVGGGVDNAFRTAVDGGSAEEILDAGITGAKYGAVLGPVMGWGGKALGKTYKVTKGVLKKADDVVPTPTAKLTRDVNRTFYMYEAENLSSSATTLNSRILNQNENNIYKCMIRKHPCNPDIPEPIVKQMAIDLENFRMESGLDFDTNVYLDLSSSKYSDDFSRLGDDGHIRFKNEDDVIFKFNPATGKLVSVSCGDNSINIQRSFYVNTEVKEFRSDYGIQNGVGDIDLTIQKMDGTPISVEEFRRKGPAIGTGQFEIFDIDPNGKRYIVGLVEKAPDGATIIERNLTSLDGTKSNYVLREEANGSRFLYNKITDSNGKCLLKSSTTFKVLSDNHFISTKNGQAFDIEIKNNKLIATKLDINNTKTSEFVEYDIVDLSNTKFKNLPLSNDYLDVNDKMEAVFRSLNLPDNSFVIDKKMLGAVKYFPGDQWFKLHDAGTRLLYGNLDVNNQACSSLGMISASGIGIQASVIAHEAGHEMFAHLNLANDTQLRNIYELEKAAYTEMFPDGLIKPISYFLKNNDQNARGINELVAETNSLINVNQNVDEFNGRSTLLQHYFPKTIAYIANKL